MRTVLLIGNGFDIAHKAPTSFLEFSEYLMKEKLIPELKKNILAHEKSIYFKTIIPDVTNQFDYPKNDNNGISNYNLHGVFDFDELTQIEMLSKNPESTWLRHLSNELLYTLYDEKSEYWFSIEDTFYRHLKIIYQEMQSSSSNREYFISELDKLNSYFNELKNYLKEYLLTLEIKKNASIELFLKEINDGKDFLNGELFILNFNYTDTIKKYNIQKSALYKYYPIHGSLKDEIIFGYGNDKDNDYQEIKEIGDDKFLEHFKTHKYLLNSTYQDIHLDLLQTKEPFEIHVIGHSLGLTDKTLLQEIFSSSNCKKIHLYKRPDKYDRTDKENKEILVQKEFTKLTMAASRIIDDEMTRIKIVNYQNSSYFPHLDKS